MNREFIKCGRKLAIICVAASAATLGSTSALADSETANSEAAIVSPLTLVKRDDLHMGTLVPATSAATVTLATDGSRTASPGVTLLGANHQVARFAGQGSLNQLVQITIDNSTNLTGPGPQMLMNNFQFGPDATAPGTYLPTGPGGDIVLLDPSGVYGFVVGGDLTVGGNQPGGNYSGTFNVTADYF